MAKAECPACENQINVGSNPRMGRRYTCPECRAELEIVWLEPVELDFVYEDEDEDYDDYDD
jgi:lysine biosynthesis protein LysW